MNRATESGHTPGPLHIDGGADWVIHAAAGEPLGEVYSRANAVLWAAAPELLQAAMACWALLESDARYEGSECKEMARAAIAKATGAS